MDRFLTAVKWCCDLLSHRPGPGLMPASASPSSCRIGWGLWEVQLNHRQRKHTKHHVYVCVIHNTLITSGSTLSPPTPGLLQCWTLYTSGGFTHVYPALGSARLPHSHPPRSLSSETRGRTGRCPGALEGSCWRKHPCCKPQNRPGVVCAAEQTRQETHDGCGESRGTCGGEAGKRRTNTGLLTWLRAGGSLPGCGILYGCCVIVAPCCSAGLNIWSHASNFYRGRSTQVTSCSHNVGQDHSLCSCPKMCLS